MLPCPVRLLHVSCEIFLTELTFLNKNRGFFWSISSVTQSGFTPNKTADALISSSKQQKLLCRSCSKNPQSRDAEWPDEVIAKITNQKHFKSSKFGKRATDKTNSNLKFLSDAHEENEQTSVVEECYELSLAKKKQRQKPCQSSA